jgi:hypothetical protein
MGQRLIAAKRDTKANIFYHSLLLHSVRGGTTSSSLTYRPICMLSLTRGKRESLANTLASSYPLLTKVTLPVGRVEIVPIPKSASVCASCPQRASSSFFSHPAHNSTKTSSSFNNTGTMVRDLFRIRLIIST